MPPMYSAMAAMSSSLNVANRVAMAGEFARVFGLESSMVLSSYSGCWPATARTRLSPLHRTRGQRTPHPNLDYNREARRVTRLGVGFAFRSHSFPFWALKDISASASAFAAGLDSPPDRSKTRSLSSSKTFTLFGCGGPGTFECIR